MIVSGLQAGTYVPWVTLEKGKISIIKLINPKLAFFYFLIQEHQKKQKMTAKSIPHIKSFLTLGLQTLEV